MRQLFKGDNYSREETIRGNTVNGGLPVLIFLVKPNLTWHRAEFAETYSQNYIFGGAYEIKPNLI